MGMIINSYVFATGGGGSTLLNDLVLYYKMNDNTNDSTGTYNATPTNISYSPGKIFDAAYFNQSLTPYIQTPTLPAMSQGTVAFWIYAVGGGGQHIGGGNVFDMQIFADSFYFRPDASGSFVNTPKPTNNTWYFIVATWDGTTISISKNNETPVTGSNSATVPAESLRIGLRDDGIFGLDTGTLIDEFGIWDRVLTSGEITELYNSGIGLTYPFDSAYDPDAQAYITATGISGAEANAINQLVLDLKSNSLWSLMQGIYPMLGNSSANASYNLKDITTLSMTYNGPWTFDANGATPDPANQTFAYPGLITSSGTGTTDFTLGDKHMSYYSTTNTSYSEDYEWGCGDGSQNILLCRFPLNGSAYTGFGSFTSTSVANATGLYIGSISGGNVYLSKNGSVIASGTQTDNSANGFYPTMAGDCRTAGVPTSSTVYPQSRSARRCAIATIGKGLSSAQHTTLATVINTFATAISRNTY